MRTILAPRLCLAALLFCASHAGAQIYKWVDESGVTHYSGQAPQPGAAEVQVVPPMSRVTVYSSALAARPARSARAEVEALEERLAELEARLAAERRAAAYAQAAAHRCLSDPRCSGASPAYAPVVVFARPVRTARFVPLRPLTGITAGNVTAGNAIQPGNFNGRAAVTAGNLVTFAGRPEPRRR